jgi:exoribonuclease R
MNTTTATATAYLEQRLGVKQEEKADDTLRGILHTDNYEAFEIRSDVGELLFSFTGAKTANRCLPGDHVRWNTVTGRCELELSDEHPLLVGTLHLTSPARYGFTSRKVPLYLFTPYDERYPQMIVGSSEKDKTCNRLCLVQWESWSATSQFPRGLLQQILGRSGEIDVEKRAILHQVCPWKYPTCPFRPLRHEQGDAHRIHLRGETFHIDPPGCRDVDDVITLERVDDRLWRVIITISDVAAYVEDGSAVDIMASLISQSVYDSSGHVLHAMLPKAYAEETCSLLPGERKRGVSMEVLWDGNTLSEPTWYESLFETQRSYTYERFQAERSVQRDVVCEIASHLAGSALEDAHEWVEQLMILYNKEAGRKLRHAGIGVLRRHAVPEREKVECYRRHLPEWKFLAMSSAEYVLAEEKDTYHCGLGTDSYAHVTSPIRRYADLINQRALKSLLHATPDTRMYFIVPVTMTDMNRREKAIRQFERDMVFLEAVQRGETRVKAIIVDKEEVDEGQEYRIQFYVPTWKKRITGHYRKVGENQVTSKDEKEIRMVTEFSEVEVQCSVQWSLRNWKERLMIQWV